MSEVATGFLVLLGRILLGTFYIREACINFKQEQYGWFGFMLMIFIHEIIQIAKSVWLL